MRFGLTPTIQPADSHDSSTVTEYDESADDAHAPEAPANDYGVSRLGLVPCAANATPTPIDHDDSLDSHHLPAVPSASALNTHLPVAEDDPDAPALPVHQPPTPASPVEDPTHPKSQSPDLTPIPLFKRGSYKLPASLIERLRTQAQQLNAYQYQLVTEAVENFLDQIESDNTGPRAAI